MREERKIPTECWVLQSITYPDLFLHMGYISRQGDSVTDLISCTKFPTPWQAVNYLKTKRDENGIDFYRVRQLNLNLADVLL